MLNNQRVDGVINQLTTGGSHPVDMELLKGNCPARWLFDFRKMWSHKSTQCLSRYINGNKNGSNTWRYVNVPFFWSYFRGCIPWNLALKNRPRKYVRYLQSIGSLKWPLIISGCAFHGLWPANDLIGYQKKWHIHDFHDEQAIRVCQTYLVAHNPLINHHAIVIH